MFRRWHLVKRLRQKEGSWAPGGQGNEKGPVLTGPYHDFLRAKDYYPPERNTTPNVSRTLFWRLLTPSVNFVIKYSPWMTRMATCLETL
jgi:hypothetical protein